MKKMLYLFLSFLITTCLLGPAFSLYPANASTPTPAEAVVQAVLFYSPTCGHCHYVITEVLSPMTEQYGSRLQIMGVDVTQPAGQQLYQAAINHYQIPEERRGVPALIIGETVLVGSQEIPAEFPKLVEAGLAMGGIGWPGIPGLPQPQAPTSTPAPPSPTAQPTAISRQETPPAAGPAGVEPVYIAYFFDLTCLACAQVSADLADLQAEYPQLVVEKFELPQEAALNEAMCAKYGLPETERLLAPMIFIGKTCLGPAEISPARLQALIEDPETAQAPPPWDGLDVDEPAATDRIVARFKQFGLLTVAGAGLLDGVNPCAFTTLIFFVSYLALVGRKGRDILLVGAAFTLAVFLSYLLMGLGLAELVRQFSAFSLIGRLIYGLTALICLGLAVVSLLDYLKIRQGRLADISLQLPKVLKQRIHETIRSHSRMRGYIGAAFGAGILVSLFELACTGQVYLPTIIFVASLAELRLTALAYLALYNLMFITPLLLVFGLAYLGTSSRQLTAIFQANASIVKLLTAVLFGLLGVWLGAMVWLTT